MIPEGAFGATFPIADERGVGRDPRGDSYRHRSATAIGRPKRG